MVKPKLALVSETLTTGQKLKRLRKAAGLNQTEVSRALGCTQGTISKLEKDEHVVTTEQLLGIRKLFGVGADDFLDGRIDFVYVAFRFGNPAFLEDPVDPKIEKAA